MIVVNIVIQCHMLLFAVFHYFHSHHEANEMSVFYSSPYWMPVAVIRAKI
jgi:hypothetical protein